MKIFFLCFTSLFINFISAQDKTLGFNFDRNTTHQDSIVPLNFDTLPKGTLTLTVDNRMANVTEFTSRNRKSIEGPKINGYRIQIFFAESRTLAQTQKANFLTAYSAHKAYIDYMAPNYRIRVGNFRTKLQAEYFKQQLIAVYPTCIVLKDQIELPVITITTE